MLPSLQDQTAQQTHGEADLQPGGEDAQDDGGHNELDDDDDLPGSVLHKLEPEEDVDWNAETE